MWVCEGELIHCPCDCTVLETVISLIWTAQFSQGHLQVLAVLPHHLVVSWLAEVLLELRELEGYSHSDQDPMHHSRMCCSHSASL